MLRRSEKGTCLGEQSWLEGLDQVLFGVILDLIGLLQWWLGQLKQRPYDLVLHRPRGSCMIRSGCGQCGLEISAVIWTVVLKARAGFIDISCTNSMGWSLRGWWQQFHGDGRRAVVVLFVIFSAFCF